MKLPPHFQNALASERDLQSRATYQAEHPPARRPGAPGTPRQRAGRLRTRVRACSLRSALTGPSTSCGWHREKTHRCARSLSASVPPRSVASTSKALSSTRTRDGGSPLRSPCGWQPRRRSPAPLIVPRSITGQTGRHPRAHSDVSPPGRSRIDSGASGHASEARPHPRSKASGGCGPSATGTPPGICSTTSTNTRSGSTGDTARAAASSGTGYSSKPSSPTRNRSRPCESHAQWQNPSNLTDVPHFSVTF